MTSNLATSRRAAVDAFLERNRQVLAAGRGRGRCSCAASRIHALGRGSGGTVYR